MRICTLLVAVPALCLAQGIPSNLDFERGNPGEVPPGWFVPGTLRAAGYKAVITREGCRTGGCALLTVPETRPPNSFGNLMATIDAVPYRWKRVLFRAAVRVETADNGSAAMWLRVDRTAGGVGLFDNMSDRPIRAGEWTFYEIRGIVDGDARTLNYGVMVSGNARAWVDDISLEFFDRQPEGPEVSAAREEIRKLYARMDAAYNAGDFDILKSIATSDSRFGSTMRKVSLQEGIERLKSSFGSATRMTTKTEIASIELAGDEVVLA